MNKRIRDVSVTMALLSVVYMIVTRFVDLDMGKWDIIVELVCGVLIALGVLTDTGKDPQPITKESLLEKLKSPLAVNSIFALIVFVIYDCSGIKNPSVIVQALSTLLFIIFGVAVQNNPNSRDSFK
jgi:hypothetical protein